MIPVKHPVHVPIEDRGRHPQRQGPRLKHSMPHQSLGDDLIHRQRGTGFTLELLVFLAIADGRANSRWIPLWDTRG